MDEQYLQQYRSIEECKFESQIQIAKMITQITHESFTIDDNTLCLGFGSFWQNYNALTKDSDIDLFLLLHYQPEWNELKLYKIRLFMEFHSHNVHYKLSPNIFIGEPVHVAEGSENLVRCLTIHNPCLDAPVLLVGNSNIHLLQLIEEPTIIPALRHALFSMIRFLNNHILTSNKDLLDNVTFQKTQQRFIQRFIEAVLLAQDFYPEIPQVLGKDDFSRYLTKEIPFEEIPSLLNLLWDKFTL